jgi:hypothetical protein
MKQKLELSGLFIPFNGEDTREYPVNRAGWNVIMTINLSCFPARSETALFAAEHGLCQKVAYTITTGPTESGGYKNGENEG